MKLLLYCVKAKPQLSKVSREYCLIKSKDNQNIFEALNGKIVAECDFEVDKLTNFGTSFRIMKYDDLQESYRYTNKVARGSCLDYTDLRRYLGTKDGYAIHIKNLHIFDEPKELSDYESFAGYKKYYLINDFVKLEKAPQNMCKVLKPYIRFNRDFKAYEDFDILISIHPEWLCKILNGEKTIEVRKKVLKEMLK